MSETLSTDTTSFEDPLTDPLPTDPTGLELVIETYLSKPLPTDPAELTTLVAKCKESLDFSELVLQHLLLSTITYLEEFYRVDGIRYHSSRKELRSLPPHTEEDIKLLKSAFEISTNEEFHAFLDPLMDPAYHKLAEAWDCVPVCENPQTLLSCVQKMKTLKEEAHHLIELAGRPLRKLHDLVDDIASDEHHCTVYEANPGWAAFASWAACTSYEPDKIVVAGRGFRHKLSPLAKFIQSVVGQCFAGTIIASRSGERGHKLRVMDGSRVLEGLYVYPARVRRYTGSDCEEWRTYKAWVACLPETILAMRNGRSLEEVAVELLRPDSLTYDEKSW
jgi:hypothetical protein